ncbi:isoprenyl transferase [Dissulfurirhabdus thermomarina]|uniref:Isoprenyl transferase n=1 Tax=Dissulfurirhabdus thermomarina TaxID=1765737 RepID=A0A6N9TUL5_DISTH|nr:isoprenyl transferase [Dissulfurirhabdus thermomarina]NDY43127.1 isoprenyl transferase [Dissulfurirhabdus thermomarina]NMX23566.1 isoprenyl transferase [Dissulfurirhabdus thermomarina]
MNRAPERDAGGAPPAAASAIRHLAVIMDGNGRWARRRGLPRFMGHRQGVQAVRTVVRACRRLEIPVLTLYSFSTENWRRPPEEVRALMDLLHDYLQRELDEMLSTGIRLRTIGEIDRLPERVRGALEDAMARTRDNHGLVLNLALSYGGRDEIVRAARRLAEACRDGRLDPAAIDEDRFAAELYTADLPDPDLLIRTGGEMRLSNFLLYQAAYTELYVTPVLWPDFGEAELLAAIDDFGRRQRRFGRTDEQVQDPCTASGS